MLEYRRPHQLWGQPTLPLNWYSGAGVSGRSVMTTHLHVGRRKWNYISVGSIYFYGVDRDILDFPLLFNNVLR